MSSGHSPGLYGTPDISITSTDFLLPKELVVYVLLFIPNAAQLPTQRVTKSDHLQPDHGLGQLADSDCARFVTDAIQISCVVQLTPEEFGSLSSTSEYNTGSLLCD